MATFSLLYSGSVAPFFYLRKFSKWILNSSLLQYSLAAQVASRRSTKAILVWIQRRVVTVLLIKDGLLI